MTRHKESQLRQHSFFQLRVHLKRGKDLIARDKSGKYTVLIHFGFHNINISKSIYHAISFDIIIFRKCIFILYRLNFFICSCSFIHFHTTNNFIQ